MDQEIKEIPLNKIKLGKNSRVVNSKADLSGLMESIKESGLLQPIGVVKEAGGYYTVCYGNRRFMAVSRLGMSKIPAVIHENKSQDDIDIKNLAENVQRSNVSILESGRYIKMLTDNGLTQKEISVRLGVAIQYVKTCLSAYIKVPKNIRHKIVNKRSNLLRPGQLSLKTSRMIVSNVESLALDTQQKEKLFEAAVNHEVKDEDIRQVALNLKGNKEDYLSVAKPLKHLRCYVLVTEEHHQELKEKYIDNGIYKYMSQVVLGVLRGEISQRINCFNDHTYKK